MATGQATSDRNLWILTLPECHLIAHPPVNHSPTNSADNDNLSFYIRIWRKKWLFYIVF